MLLTQPRTPLADFVAEVEALVAVQRDQRTIAAGVQSRLHDLLDGPAFLSAAQRAPDPAHYRSHLLAVAPSRRFSVVGLVWLPGQVTPIHDHICWCVVGVLQGVERERRFGLHAGARGARWLVPESDEMLHADQTSVLVPPDENIHQVRNAGDSLAISIHVYGEDIERYTSSINQCFDDLPIRPASDAEAGLPVAWRRVRWA